MHFSSLSNFLVVALATCAAAAPVSFNGGMVVGFRRASPEQAELYNKNGIFFDTSRAMWGSQIGQGVYTSPSRDDYAALAADDAWYCVLKANEAAFNQIPKAWIPEKNQSKQRMWNQSTETRIDQYIQSFGKDPATTLRFSIMPHGKDRSRLQMLIPPALATPDNFAIECYEKQVDVTEGDIDYDTWSILGEKGN